MKVPEPTEEQNDKAYREYLKGYGRGPVGFLMMIAGLEAAKKAMESREDANGRFTKDRKQKDAP